MPRNNDGYLKTITFIENFVSTARDIAKFERLCSGSRTLKTGLGKRALSVRHVQLAGRLCKRSKK